MVNRGDVIMILTFNDARTSECVVIKETKQYITFKAISNWHTYRLNKKTMEVQDGIYHKSILRLFGPP